MATHHGIRFHYRARACPDGGLAYVESSNAPENQNDGYYRVLIQTPVRPSAAPESIPLLTFDSVAAVAIARLHWLSREIHSPDPTFVACRRIRTSRTGRTPDITPLVNKRTRRNRSCGQILTIIRLTRVMNRIRWIQNRSEVRTLSRGLFGGRIRGVYGTTLMGLGRPKGYGTVSIFEHSLELWRYSAWSFQARLMSIDQDMFSLGPAGRGLG